MLVIDAQQSFTRRPYFSATGLASYLVAQNALIEGARRLGLPLVRVLHAEPQAAGDDPFNPASGWVRPLEGLAAFDADLTVSKSRHSALVGTGLDVWLTEQGVRRLIISGIRTEQCCETTARHASDLGWQVVFALDATLTWDMQLPDGRPLPASALRERTAAVLHRRFAEVVDVMQALDHAAD